MENADPLESRDYELLDITQEECAEAIAILAKPIQRVSKIKRFGLHNRGPNATQTKRDLLVEELGDVFAMIDLLVLRGLFTWDEIHERAEYKRTKMVKWYRTPEHDK